MVDRPYVFPGSVVPFALGPYDVMVQLISLVDDGSWDLSSSAGDLNSTSWLGPSSGSSLVPWVQSKCVLCLLLGQQVVSYSLHVNLGSRLTGVLEDPVMEDLLSEKACWA